MFVTFELLNFLQVFDFMKTRKFLLLIKHERQDLHLDLDVARHRVTAAFDCRSILVSVRETDSYYLYSFGIVCFSSSKSTVLAEKARGLFDYYHAEVLFFKGLGPLYTYFASRGEFQVFGHYSQEQICVMARQTQYHKRMNCADADSPQKSRNSSKHFNSPFSNGFVIKRSALAAVIFNIVGYLFDKVKPIIDQTVAQYFLDFIHGLINILLPREEGEEAPVSSTSGRNVALFFVGLGLLSLIRVLANLGGS